MIPEPCDVNCEVTVTETFHLQTDDELSDKELKQIEADDQSIQTILLGLPEGIYAAVDSCETAQEIWLQVHQMMKGSDIGIQDKNAKLFNEWERFTSNEGESIESYYHPDYTQLYDFLKYNQKEVDELKAERLTKTQDPLALMVNSNNPYDVPAPHQDQSSFNQNFLQQPIPNPEDITDPTTAINMALALITKSFKLNYSTPTKNNHRISSNPRNRQIAQSADLDEIKEVNANCISMANLQQASTSGTHTDIAPIYDSDGSAEVHENCDDKEIFNMFTQEEQYTEILEPILESHQVPQNDNDVISEDTSVEQDVETVEQHPANFEETCALYDSLYQNLATKIEKVNSVNRKLKETNADLTNELARFKNQTRKKKLKSDFKTREDKLLDKQIQLEKKIKELNNILLKTGQSIQTIHMLSLKQDSFYHTEQKMALGYQNPFYLKQAQKKQKSLYDGKILLEKHDPPVVHDSEETLQLAQESREKMKQLNKEINQQIIQRLIIFQGFLFHKRPCHDFGFELTGFSDADYAGCKDTFKSTSGGAQFLGEKIVSWSSKKQDCTALSTAKAEYVHSHILQPSSTFKNKTYRYPLTFHKGARGKGAGGIYPGILPLDRVEVLGSSHEASVSTEGVEELKRIVRIKGVKKEALHTTLVTNGNPSRVNIKQLCGRTMDTTINQQVAMDEALVPHAKRLRIGKSNFRLLSDIKSKESALQLVYDVLRLFPFFKAVLVEHKDTKKINEMYYPRFTKVIIHHFMSKDPSIPRRNKNTQQFDALLPIELTNEDIRNSNAYQEYYAVATGVRPPKPKASVWKTKSSSDITITPPTAVAGPRLTTSQKGKQAAKASKAKNEGTGSIPGVPDVPTDESEEELSSNSTDEEDNDDEGKDGNGDEEDDGDDGEEGDGDDDDQEVERDDENDDEEECGDDEQDSDEEEFIHPILSTHTEEEPRDEESLEQEHVKEEEEDELYRDVNINQGRGIQTTQEVEDSHVTLTPVNPDGQQQSSSVSSQFVTN
uniref:Uncharacterized protein n=1 Tax=Tanacetum cinerariifolium TaxID=118510 RepID=A0A6L2N3X2_TANCI|nr:hypothetical protein [Tanacetum cinerariifolium]